MRGRRQQINLQLTELTASKLLAFFLWFGHCLRADLAVRFLPLLETVTPLNKSFWQLPVIVPFTPIILEGRGFKSNLLNKTQARSIPQLLGVFVIIGMIIGTVSIFVR